MDSQHKGVSVLQGILAVGVAIPSIVMEMPFELLPYCLRKTLKVTTKHFA